MEKCPVGRATDFVVDPLGRKLIGNPAHGGQQMLEMF